jgi:hypothetical protein
MPRYTGRAQLRPTGQHTTQENSNLTGTDVMVCEQAQDN